MTIPPQPAFSLAHTSPHAIRIVYVLNTLYPLVERAVFPRDDRGLLVLSNDKSFFLDETLSRPPVWKRSARELEPLTMTLGV